MADQIIKQPNGRYCIFSSVVDNITYYNMNKEDIIELRIKQYRQDITKKITETVEALDKGEKPYYQFTRSYDQMLNDITAIHGKKESKKVNNLITKDAN